MSYTVEIKYQINVNVLNLFFSGQTCYSVKSHH